MAKKDKKEIKNSKDKTSFFKSFKAELKKVIWPTPKQVFNNTLAVLVIVIITGLIVFVLDFAFESMNKYGIDKIKESISNSVIDEKNSTENNESQENNTNNEATENNSTIENVANSTQE